VPRLNTPEDKRIGQRIRAARNSAGIPQTALAEALGVTFQQSQKYENGTNRVTVGRLQPLARVLGVPVSYLTEGSFSPRPAVVRSWPPSWPSRMPIPAKPF
jgi:transcriptional regulator with XRE-family HTH domain